MRLNPAHRRSAAVTRIRTSSTMDTSTVMSSILPPANCLNRNRPPVQLTPVTLSHQEYSILEGQRTGADADCWNRNQKCRYQTCLSPCNVMQGTTYSLSIQYKNKKHPTIERQERQREGLRGANGKQFRPFSYLNGIKIRLTYLYLIMHHITCLIIMHAMPKTPTLISLILALC